MGMKKGVHALTKTMRVGSGLFVVGAVIGELINGIQNGFWGSGLILFYAALVAIPAWTAAWILDSFVE